MSDIYSLGVVLFQMVTGDFKRGSVRANAVEDELLRDILSLRHDPRAASRQRSDACRSLRRLEARRAERAARSRASAGRARCFASRRSSRAAPAAPPARRGPPRCSPPPGLTAIFRVVALTAP
jgi:hypothetical protein